jgi:glucose-1-phosphate adenylyltransferase
MAGGRGERLDPLTRYRTKPAVPFGGRYRIVDFVLSNLVNSGITAIYVLTQYKAQSVLEHIQQGWMNRVAGYGSFVQVVPAQMQMGDRWYRGTADAIYQNIELLRSFKPDVVVVFGADHVYKMNIQQMIDFHFEVGAKACVACLCIPRQSATAFGVVDIDGKGKIKGFLEKPPDPPGMPGRPEQCLVSMGNYSFDPSLLVDALKADAERADSRQDFGRDILPALTQQGLAWAYDFSKNRIPGASAEEEHGYWQDVGTIEAYYEANLDLKNPLPKLNLYNWKWPIMTARFNDPPAKFVLGHGGQNNSIVMSIISPSCIIAGGSVADSVFGRNVCVDKGAQVESSILMDNVYIGPGARVRRAIIDKNVRIENGQTVGFDLKVDQKRYPVSETGIVVIPKASEIPERHGHDW